jgi:hypothetical protein
MRPHRRPFAIVTLLGFFAFQWLVAAHACAMPFHPQDTPAPVSAATHHCGAPDSAPATLCIEHCTQGKDATNALPAGDVPTPAAIAFLTVPSLPASPTGTGRASSTAPASRSHSPPPLTLSQRLRI